MVLESYLSDFQNLSKVIDLSLYRITTLLHHLGDPHKKIPSVVHIAGTNGKGSIFSYLKFILEESGYKVHGYISPHLIRFNERFIVAGKEISDSALERYTRIVKGVIEDNKVDVTFFEAITAMAFLIFSEAKADITLLETGLGGLLDATNVCDSIVSVITPISIDHVDFLGDTVEKIATEKSGIIKNNSVCVIAEQREAVVDVLLDKCIATNSTSLCCNVDWCYEVIDGDQISIDISKIKDKLRAKPSSNLSSNLYELILSNAKNFVVSKPNLVGVHQFGNAATSVITAVLLSLMGYDKISHNAINRGLENTKWLGRMQKIDSGAIYKLVQDSGADKIEIWFDGAHNDGGAEALSRTIKSLMKDKPIYMIYGRSRTRDTESFMSYFDNMIKKVYCVNIKDYEDKVDSSDLHRAISAIGFDSEKSDSINDAVKNCIDDCGEGGCYIIITGSLYMVAEVFHDAHDAKMDR